MSEKTNFDRYLEHKLANPEFRARFDDASRAWNVPLQLAALRKERGLTQRQVTDMQGTHQQAIARLTDPCYVNQSLKKVRKYAEALGALVDVVVVPNEKAAEYKAGCGPKPLLAS
jgi:hypothetical protein